ncbi:hypothetical protein DY000_02013461 [Brassica cretica]|uniref:TF-B3 domain-containing protein n=1 Tax=Brassica cretica TaxID=69181 RepID=A0ABQ7CNT5_BRACR|nr:hypothetical protein DY000_02013461 [Brassica cretica]
MIHGSLTDSDLCYGGPLNLPKRDFESYILSEMENVMVQNLGSSNGVEVKIYILEEGYEADDYTITLIKKTSYKFIAGWSNIAKAKGYITGDEIGLLWDKIAENSFFVLSSSLFNCQRAFQIFI